MRILLFLNILILTACDSIVTIDHAPEEISGRHGENLWQIRPPEAWFTKARPQDIHDTRLPIKEYLISENISFLIHSFPSSTIEERIPPLAQIHRWKNQFDQEPTPEFHVACQAFSGYSGYLLDARGCIKGKNTRVLAWALALPAKSYFSLKNPEARSDITFKVTGDEESMDLHEDTIRKTARTFELIEAIL